VAAESESVEGARNLTRSLLTAPWLTVLFEEGEASENEEASEENEELSGGASQPSGIRRE
jgi:hypothetical protein